MVTGSPREMGNTTAVLRVALVHVCNIYRTSRRDVSLRERVSLTLCLCMSVCVCVVVECQPRVK